MAGDQSPQGPRDEDKAASGSSQGSMAISYLIGGILVWGFVGWLVDQWLDTGGIATAVGAVLGAAGGVYLLVKRMGT